MKLELTRIKLEQTTRKLERTISNFKDNKDT